MDKNTVDKLSDLSRKEVEKRIQSQADSHNQESIKKMSAPMVKNFMDQMFRKSSKKK